MTSFFRCHQHNTAINTSKNATAVNICDKNYICMGIKSHRHIDNIYLAQIDFRNTSCPFHHNRIETGCQTIKCFMSNLTKAISSFLSKIASSRLIAVRTSQQDYLRCMVRLRFQQDGIHIGLTRDSCRFSLYSLSAS